MDFVKKNILLFLIGLIVFLVVISYLYFQFFPSKNKQAPPPTTIFRPISTSPTPSPSSTYKGIKQIVTEEDKITATQQIAVTNLTLKLPFTGNNFIISYDINTNTFYVQITGKLVSANKELDTFLKQNSIMSRSWITHLIIK